MLQIFQDPSKIEKSVRGLNVYVSFGRKDRLAIQLQSEEKMVVF